jgi:hypothetical protein
MGNIMRRAVALVEAIAIFIETAKRMLPTGGATNHRVIDKRGGRALLAATRMSTSRTSSG